MNESMQHAPASRDEGEASLTELWASIDGGVGAIVFDLEANQMVSSIGQMDPSRLELLRFAVDEFLGSGVVFSVRAALARRADLPMERHAEAVTEAVTVSSEGFCLFQRFTLKPQMVLVTVCARNSNLAQARIMTRKFVSNDGPFVQA